MIHVKRSIPAPDILLKKDNNGLTPADKIARHFRLNPQISYVFSVYNAGEVKAALRIMFGDKCGFCEGKYAAFHAMVVEHFRPKSAVRDHVGTLTKPGYHWLAVEWTNLLACCFDCNSWRNHIDESGNTIKSGKENYFPLADYSKRARAVGEEHNEQPLLLDPTVDDPELHLEFDNNGIVSARQTDVGMASAIGAESIQVLGLYRHDLTRSRRAHAVRVLGAVETLRRTVKRVKQYPSDDSFKVEAKAQLDELMSFLHPSAEYSAMVRDILQRESLLS